MRHSAILLLTTTVTVLGLPAAESVAADPARVARSRPLVPGSGTRLGEFGAAFEAVDWTYLPHFPKASRNLDNRKRLPAGRSLNGLWLESTYRGQPDQVYRIATPTGGLPGSRGSMLMRSLHSGIPRRPSPTSQQDDLIFSGGTRSGGSIDVRQSPSFVVRVYLPPWQYWDNVTDTSLGIRADVTGTRATSRSLVLPAKLKKPAESYWPGFFVQFNSPNDPEFGGNEPSALILLRAGSDGHDVVGPLITRPGWWTFGMSFTPDGRVHYYASPGVDRLTARDRLGSYVCYGLRAARFNSFFFNIISRNDGRHWSTPWIVDDPYVFVGDR